MKEKEFEKAKSIMHDLKEVNRNIETLDYTQKTRRGFVRYTILKSTSKTHTPMV